MPINLARYGKCIAAMNPSLEFHQAEHPALYNLLRLERNVFHVVMILLLRSRKFGQ
jgi:hypothetical protein